MRAQCASQLCCEVQKGMRSVMNKWLKKGRLCVVLAIVCIMLFGVHAFASEDDNSLSSLGILTEGATVSPEFAYNTWSYTVTVPGGTKELSLDPVPSSSSASISSINGTVLNEDGTGYVTITVQAGNGSQFTYELNVVSDGTVPAAETETETETETEKATEKQTEPETEDSQYVKVDKNSLQEAENTITNLKGQITVYKDKVSLFTKIMYGLIGLAVILLFVVINLLLKKKDLKAELNDYRSYGYTDNKKSQKAQQKADKKQQKADKKQEKADKKQKKAAPAMEDDMEFVSEQPRSGVKPASMQNGYGAPDMYAQYGSAGREDSMQPQSQPYEERSMQGQPVYQGLDVQPQVSQKKSKQMPQYEQPQQPKPQQAPQNQPAPAQTSGKAPKKGKKNDVEINMIDL